MTDPIRQFLRHERAASIRSAPQPHAARAWQLLRQRRAARLERLMIVAGWTTRLLIALAAAVTAFVSPHELGLVALVCGLVTWLSSGACTSLRRAATGQPFSRPFDDGGSDDA